MRISFITTVFNEEETIEKLLDSLLAQTRLPDEIIIVDGGSSDLTVAKIENRKSKIKIYKGFFKILIKRGNRSIGRNEAIKNATGNIIVCSDAGCVLDKDWIKNITGPFINSGIDVVAGYYKGLSTDVFQKCLTPYVLVMPERVDANNFLPATRSMAFRKSAWEKTGGFDERFYHNEDYVFAKKLKKTGAKIIFERNAIVYWLPRKNLTEAFIMFFRFAMGDAHAKIFRPKVILIFARYLIGTLLFASFLITESLFILYSLYFILLMYCLWVITKNYKYINDFRAILFLPILQITSDIAVITGTIAGLYKIWDIKKTL